MAVVGDAWGIGGSRKRGALVERLTLAACVLALATGFAPPVAAQPPETLAETHIAFDLPAQDLNAALLAFADRVGLQLVYDVGLVEGLSNAPLKGAFAPRDGLAQLLAGTGLAYRFTGADAVSIYRLDGAAEEGGPLHTGPVTVEAAFVPSPADTPFTTPGSSAYISREQIERIQPSSPGDIFKETPGVLSGASHDGTSINVNIRSAQGLNRVRTMVEGTQQESSGYQGYAGADQRTYIDPELIGGVEITKGPGGGAYSTGTTAGIVNMRLLDADDVIRDGRSADFRLRGGFGGNATAPTDNRNLYTRNPDEIELADDSDGALTNDNWFGSVAGAYRSDRVEFVGAYARRQEGNYFAGKDGPETFTALRQSSDGPTPDEFRFTPIDPGQEVPNTSEDTESILVKGTLRFRDGQYLEAGYTRYDSEFGQVFPTNITLWPPQQYDLNEVDSKRYWLRYKWESDSDLVNLQANLWRTRANERGESRQAPQENDAWGAELWNTSFFDTGLGGLTLIYGAEYSTSEAVVDADRTVRGRQWVPGPGGEVDLEETLYPTFDGSREVFGSYLNAVLAPTDWLTLNAGIRYDSFNAESSSAGFLCEVDFTELDRAIATGNAAAAEARDRRAEYDQGIFDDFQAGLITLEEARFLITEAPEALALQAALDEAVRAATAARQAATNNLDGFCGSLALDSDFDGERFSPRIGVTVEPLNGLQLFAQYSEGFRAPSLVELGQTYDGPVTVNPDLEPEVVETWEVGANILRDSLFFDGDALRAKLVYFNNDYDNFVTRTGFVKSRQGGFFFFYENVPDVTVSGYEASLSYDVGRVFADLNANLFDAPLDVPTQASIDQPEYAGTATLGTRWLDETLVLGARVNFFGEPNVDGPLEVGFTSNYWAANEILDLFGAYRVNDHLFVRFSVENVNDRFYTAPLFVSRIPAPGRTGRLSLSLQF